MSCIALHEKGVDGTACRPGAKPPRHGPAKHVKRMPKKHRRRGRAGSLRGGGGVGVAGLLRLTSNLLTSESSGASSGHGDYDEQACG